MENTLPLYLFSEGLVENGTPIVIENLAPLREFIRSNLMPAEQFNYERSTFKLISFFNPRLLSEFTKGQILEGYNYKFNRGEYFFNINEISVRVHFKNIYLTKSLIIIKKIWHQHNIRFKTTDEFNQTVNHCKFHPPMPTSDYKKLMIDDGVLRDQFAEYIKETMPELIFQTT